MVTYPSTHGVFEDTITDLCAIVHDHGGQVYVDGANLNALLGLAKPGEFGGDVSHLNLHKTFCIPHGGGGPGVGPVAVAEHLVPFLPSHPGHPDAAERDGIGPISAAPYGIGGHPADLVGLHRMMGAEGLTRATMVAILSANYVAQKLQKAFPVLYTGHGGLVAHECILDVRGLTKSSGVTVDDVAKRLIDYGFHAPTMSFPVPGTLMVEPTESESLAELDRFCDAMVAIRQEIDDIEQGRVAVDESALRHAPHTTHALVGDWSRSYSRLQGAFPAGHTPDKYWPPVARIDQAYGDRHLVCSCPPPEAFESAADHEGHEEHAGEPAGRAAHGASSRADRRPRAGVRTTAERRGGRRARRRAGVVRRGGRAVRADDRRGARRSADVARPTRRRHAIPDRVDHQDDDGPARHAAP